MISIIFLWFVGFGVFIKQYFLPCRVFDNNNHFSGDVSDGLVRWGCGTRRAMEQIEKSSNLYNAC